MQTLCFCIVIFFLLLPGKSLAQMVINEIAAFEVAQSEWIEIFNAGQEAVDLSGWKFFEDGTSHTLKVYQGDFFIDAGEYAIIANKADVFVQEKLFDGTVFDSSWGSLKEDGEQIGLKNADGEYEELFTYIAAKNFSLERQDALLEDYSDKNWQEHKSGHTAGIQNSNVLEQEIKKTKNQARPRQAEGAVGEVKTPEPVVNTETAKVVLNEIYPNPPGPDTKDEFIEIKNISRSFVDLSNWKIKTKAGAEFIIKNIGIAPGVVYAWQRPETNLALQNSAEKISLYSSSGKKVDEVVLNNAQKAFSYNRNQQGKWFWHNDVSPGKDNIESTITKPPFVSVSYPKEVLAHSVFVLDASDSFDPEGGPLQFQWDFGDEGTASKMSPFFSFSIAGEHEVTLTVIDETSAFAQKSFTINVKGEDKETEILAAAAIEPEDNYAIVTGYVLSEPGVLGSQIMYIGDELGGIQVYMFSKEWPQLFVGDFIEVTGELTQANGEARLKINSESNIQIIEQGNIIEPTTSLVTNSLITITGEVTESKGNGFYIDDGQKEVYAYIKQSTNIKKEFVVGDMVTVIGVLVENNSGIRLLPRYQDDIVVAKKEVLDNALEDEIPTRVKQDSTKRYYIIAYVLLALFSVFVFLKKRKSGA